MSDLQLINFTESRFVEIPLKNGSNLSSAIQLLWGLRHFVKVLRRLFLFGSAKITLEQVICYENGQGK